MGKRRSACPVKVMKVRLDKLILQRGLASSRERAQALVLAGRVLVNEQKLDKSGASVDEDAALRILGVDMPFVSRGGLKLTRAIEQWRIDVRGKVCLDIGASTGGFTDCLLRNGAAQVIAVDTGYGQIDARLRGDSRVRLLERTNARYLRAEQAWADPTTGRVPISLVVMDVSFISATLVLPAVISTVSESAPSDGFEVVVLVKPQFEVGREQVGKGGVVRDAIAHQRAVQRVSEAITQLGGKAVEVIESPVFGTQGNREFLLHARFE